LKHGSTQRPGLPEQLSQQYLESNCIRIAVDTTFSRGLVFRIGHWTFRWVVLIAVLLFHWSRVLRFWTTSMSDKTPYLRMPSLSS